MGKVSFSSDTRGDADIFLWNSKLSMVENKPGIWINVLACLAFVMCTWCTSIPSKSGVSTDAGLTKYSDFIVVISFLTYKGISVIPLWHSVDRCKCLYKVLYWPLENPLHCHTVWHQVHWLTNMWYSILGTQIVGLIFYERTLTANRFLHQIQNMILNWQKELPLRYAYQVWFNTMGLLA